MIIIIIFMIIIIVVWFIIINHLLYLWIILLNVININYMNILIIIIIVWYYLYYNYTEIILTEFYIYLFCTVINDSLYFKALFFNFKLTLQLCLVMPFMVLEQQSRLNNKLCLINKMCNLCYMCYIGLTVSSNLRPVSVDFQNQDNEIKYKRQKSAPDLNNSEIPWC